VNVEKVIPMLPCSSINETLEFYQALGFEVTYQQAKPNMFASVKYKFIELQFFVKKNWSPSFCYISVTNVDEVYQAFAAGVKTKYGKILSKGNSRITKVNNLKEDRRFNVIDPSGNWLYIGQPLEKSGLKILNELQQNDDSHLAKVLETAYLLAYSKADPPAAAKVLDVAFAKNETVSATVHFKALVLRADVATMMDDTQIAKAMLEEARAISLQEDERNLLQDELQRMKELE
jgi:catechol 2,3-dioxygenase-like lactoylglutathione lyase family enzyme